MEAIFGQAVQEFYLEQLRRNYRERQERLRAVRNAADALAYVRQVREKIRRLFRLPVEKCPLAVETLGELRFDGFRMEKLRYYSRPGFAVTANLYVPDGLSAPAPAVLEQCGHTAEGKAGPIYQQAARGLALAGCVALVIDPIGQGDRGQFLRVPGFKGACWDEHSIIGKQLIPLGDWLGSWMAWDGIRGIDLLLSRPEVDATRIAVTGTSGGGTATTFVGALDDRISMLAPSCYITSWLRNVSNERPTDNEQMPPGALAAGLEIADFLIAQAPRPTLIMGQKNDFFDARGTREAYEDVAHIYDMLGAPGAVELVIGPSHHTLCVNLREALYSFVTRRAGLPDMRQEPADIPVSTPDELCCAETAPRVARELFAEDARRRIAQRPSLSADERRAFFRDALRLELPVMVPAYRVLRETRLDGWTFSRFGLETEPERVMALLLRRDRSVFYHLPEEQGDITLYIPHVDAKDEMAAMPDDGPLWGLDLRGVGELTPAGCYQDRPRENFFRSNGFDYNYAALGMMLDRPYLGGKVRDILGALALLGRGGARVRLVARGQGCVPAQLAAMFAECVVACEFIDQPESWAEAVLSDLPALPQSAMLFGVIDHADWR